MTTRIKASYCPACNHKLDAATHPSDPRAKPVEDDITICINCAEILQFDLNIKPKKLKGELSDILSPTEVNEVSQIRQMIINSKTIN